MTIPKKGRRSISVKGADYHYKIAFERSERVIIQSAKGIGACIFVLPFAIMKPKHAADAIRFAKANGWMSDGGRDACWLAFDVDAQDRSYFEHIPNDDFRVLSYPSLGRIPAGMDASQFDDTRAWYQRESPTAKTD